MGANDSLPLALAGATPAQSTRRTSTFNEALTLVGGARREDGDVADNRGAPELIMTSRHVPHVEANSPAVSLCS